MTRVASFPHLNPRFRSVSGGYQRTVLDYSPLAFWPMDEASGSVAYDRSGNGYNGAYTGVELGQPGQFGRTCPLFGTGDFNNFYSAGFAGAFSATAGTFALWAKVLNVGVWTDAAVHFTFNVGVNSSYDIRIIKSANNTLQYRYKANLTSSTITQGSVTTTNWMHCAITWSVANNQVIAYFNGAQQGTPQAIGTWSGSLGSAVCCIGAQTDTASTPWSGWLQWAAVWTRALTAPEIARLYSG